MSLPNEITVVAGTYDGVLVGWNNEKDVNKLEMEFASHSHEGSVRCISVLQENGIMASGGFDESIKVFDLKKKREMGETKTHGDLGAPMCSDFATESHLLVGLVSGKIAMYKRKDWAVVHILAGHEGGISCIASHPSGKLALSGGVKDGKLNLWDLTKGRLAFVHKLKINDLDKSNTTSKKPLPRVNCIRWSTDGSMYAFCYGKHVTARDAASGKDLLDIELPARPNQICFIGENDECLACACDDGSLPVLGVGVTNDEEDQEEGLIRAVMAIEGVDRLVVGDDRLKCIQRVYGKSKYLVGIANSGGYVSVVDLAGASRALNDDVNNQSGGKEDSMSDSEKDDSEEEEEEEEEDLAEFLASVRVGSGARITTISVWSSETDQEEQSGHKQGKEKKSVEEKKDTTLKENDGNMKRKWNKDIETVKLKPDEISRARVLVDKAKKRQMKKKRKKEQSKK